MNEKKSDKGKSDNSFAWCEIDGAGDAYCMSHTCYFCPANKNGPNYNPQSELVKTHRHDLVV